MIENYKICKYCHGYFHPMGIITIFHDDLICYRCNDEKKTREQAQYDYELETRLDHVKSLKEYTKDKKYFFDFFIMRGVSKDALVFRVEKTKISNGQTEIVYKFTKSETEIMTDFNPDEFENILKEYRRKDENNE